LRYALAPGFSGDPSGDIREALWEATRQRWTVDLVDESGAPTLREVAEAAKAAEQAALRRSPLVEAAFAAFPNAQIVEDDGGERAWSKRA
jgi:DNA polymerase-3 subunit gamma/tau